MIIKSYLIIVSSFFIVMYVYYTITINNQYNIINYNNHISIVYL